MPIPLRGSILTREGMATGLVQLKRRDQRGFTWKELAHADIPPRGCLVGQWGDRSGDPLPDLVIVRTEDRADTLAWVSSFFAGITPLTQWCRLLTQEQAGSIATGLRPVGLGNRLGLWVGAILAECSVQSDGAVNLKEMPGSAALSSATYAAGRAAAMWGEAAPFADLANRHDELTARLREGPRRIPAAALRPLWDLLVAAEGVERTPLHPFNRILSTALDLAGNVDTAEVIQAVSVEATDHFDIPELVECARGPQSDRLRALDRLADRLARGPRSPATEGLLGLAASFVDPGAAVMPDLLRRHSGRQPLAPVWLGAFAGAWAPARVLNDQQGLGRLVSKALLGGSDLEARPIADIAFEELIRWLPPQRSVQRLDLRGMASRTLSVELLPGVTSSFALARAEQTNTSPAQKPEFVREERPVPIQAPAAPNGQVGKPSIEDVWEGLMSLTQRVNRLERGEGGVQSSLDLPGPGSATTKGKPARKRER